MSLIDRIRALDEVRRTASVEAWGEDGKPAVLYALPLSVKDMSWVQRKHKAFLEQMQVEGMVDLIILKCEDKKGDKCFSNEDKPILMRKAGLTTIAGIFGDLWGDLGDDAEKN